jgi:hypothetical protein
MVPRSVGPGQAASREVEVVRIDEYAIEQRARRIGITLDTLKEIEAVVIHDSNSNLDAQRERIGQAVALYAALLVAESQK